VTHPWPMPAGIPLGALCRLEGDTLRLCVPLSPSQNQLNHWHWAKRGRYRDTCYPLLAWQVSNLVDCRPGREWARRVELSLVRCSTATRAADPSNLWAGLKGPIDVLARLGLFPDDGPAYVALGCVNDRARGHWCDLKGPGSYLYIRRLA